PKVFIKIIIATPAVKVYVNTFRVANNAKINPSQSLPGKTFLTHIYKTGIPALYGNRQKPSWLLGAPRQCLQSHFVRLRLFNPDIPGEMEQEKLEYMLFHSATSQ
ncbi:hypothetical protein L9F63_006957, partial [Diploptera punctata]